mmetsp:Transcript_39347/g.47684  ORF Transcript_39347/g.47684 Transcript_39347/m.47684 type:complete len:755 (+) Transcript_39347:160-2424(+)|eukprot:CAMPEP_0197847830 /NCGR_PEP_ID=MMETSP1438-20131217/7224_1 /TAXON_ID=1461541 /ORGANISM="Pterosperma sp., Strain CCMP1384" /LENGTH=754 /DNA_ID=CAMNT_0043459867 /DNA_START=134 /DNA_END=2398 /DNA_ORIENTATION=-
MNWILGVEGGPQGDNEAIAQANKVIQDLVVEREDLQKQLNDYHAEYEILEQSVQKLEKELQEKQVEADKTGKLIDEQDGHLRECLQLSDALTTHGTSLTSFMANLLRPEPLSGSELAAQVIKTHKAAGIITPEMAQLATALIAEDQHALFSPWPVPGEQDANKLKMMKQLMTLDSSYAGGIVKYITNARTLLEDSRAGKNPLEGWTPSVPEGVVLSYGGEEFSKFEAAGVNAMSQAAFVLVAGGLGERLGYSGIKVALPTENVSKRCFLSLYINSILSLQELTSQATGQQCTLPLAIMTSDDTHARTQQLLEDNSYFGMLPTQITLLKQEKVGCLTDNEAHLAVKDSDPFTLQTKPHGHGDVHSLLHSSGTLSAWKAAGLKWVCFFQDTNALLFRAITAALGVSAVQSLAVNSLAVPRKGAEAIGGIAKLKHSDGRVMTLNVEYNQLDPLLRATIAPDGDKNDPATGYSPFPGNINQLVLSLDEYMTQLNITGGAIAEFVNPKYANKERTKFKAPTRLECMMQDYPKGLPESSKVGFTTLEVWAAYTPVKNSPAEARAKMAVGAPTHSATSGEFDIYRANGRILKSIGAQLGDPEVATFNGLALELGPRIVWSPSFGVARSTIAEKVKGENVVISSKSVLLLDGPNIVVHGLNLDGALLIKACPGANVTINNLNIKNNGWTWRAIDEADTSLPEVDRIRGFQVDVVNTCELEFTKPGEYIVSDQQIDEWKALSGEEDGQSDAATSDSGSFKFTI